MIPSSRSEQTSLLFEQSTSQSERATPSPPADEPGAQPPREPESTAPAASSSLMQGAPVPLRVARSKAALRGRDACGCVSP